MTAERHRNTQPSNSRGAAAGSTRPHGSASRFAGFAAAVAAALLLGGAPVAAEPTFRSWNASFDFLADNSYRISAGAHLFTDAGTNPRFTDVVFSTLEYYRSGSTGIQDGVLVVTIKSATELSALASPPSSPFTVTADVTMTNDEGETASGTLQLKTTYTATSAPPERPKPSFVPQDAIPAPVRAYTHAYAKDVFANAGTNPRFSGVTFSTLEYYSTGRITNGVVQVVVKSAEKLRALPLPPPSPFTVTAEVTMTNDEGDTASGTLTFRTTYDTAPSVQAASPPPKPSFKHPQKWDLPLNRLTIWRAGRFFDNAGTNPRFTEVMFSTEDYYRFGATTTGIRSNQVYVRTKTAEQLNALALPPPSPFTVTATATMVNDEGQTATGTFAFTTSYPRASSAPPLPSGPPPVFKPQRVWTMPLNTLTSWRPAEFFDNAGTNPVFTDAVFSTEDYYQFGAATTGIRHGRVFIRTKTAGQLNALALPPPSPFMVSAAVTMTNDEGHTATGTFAFRTTYPRDQ